MPQYAPAVTEQQALAVARLWAPETHEVVHVRSGENSVWSFEDGGGRILRITSAVHRTIDLAKGELAFVEHLVACGMNAAPPVASLTGAAVVDISQIVSGDSSTHATVFERLEGRHFEYFSSDIDRPLFEQWGRTMGRLHLLAREFTAPLGLRRPDWNDDEVAGCSLEGLDVDSGLSALRNELVGWLGAADRDPAHYGMVHGDFERTNFVLKDGAIGLFDFDDCCHHWFCWDIVCALWPLRQANERDRAAFLGWFLEGYAAVREPDTARLERFSELMRLRAISVLLYRARARTPHPSGDWAQRTRAWLDSAWHW